MFPLVFSGTADSTNEIGVMCRNWSTTHNDTEKNGDILKRKKTMHD